MCICFGCHAAPCAAANRTHTPARPLGVTVSAVARPNATLLPVRTVAEVMTTMLGTVNTSRTWALQRLGQRETLTNAQLTNPPAVLNEPTGGTGVNVYVLSSV